MTNFYGTYEEGEHHGKHGYGSHVVVVAEANIGADDSNAAALRGMKALSRQGTISRHTKTFPGVHDEEAKQTQSKVFASDRVLATLSTSSDHMTYITSIHGYGAGFASRHRATYSEAGLLGGFAHLLRSPDISIDHMTLH